MATTPTPTTLYRIVRTRYPSWSDFLSNQVRDQPRRGVEITDPLEWAGVSTFDTLHEARVRAKAIPALGRYIAELRIPDPTSVLVVPSVGPGHWSIVGGPGVLLGCVAQILPV
jgi:hypothetical protein